MTNAPLNFQELPSQYDHEAAQAKWYKVWEERGYFHAEPGAKGADGKPKKPYTIVIPPPNVTGALHLGHALNNTLQDILIRMKRMQGFNALWMPGTDHAGIATQAVVERRLLEEEKLSRHDLGREGLVERIWTWKQQYEKRILGQLKQLGCSCDWQRLRFTLDDQCARAVRETFFRLFKDGKIYRGKRLVNWDTYLQTAVSDDEVFKEPIKGHFWHFKYPVIKNAAWKQGDPEFVTIATTRPETMLGDTAVAVHPHPVAAFDKVQAELREKMLAATDKERAELNRQAELLLERREKMLPQLERLRDMAKRCVKLRLPLAEREIPLIADEWAKPELGSGAVKITPAHDENDYAVGQRHPEIGPPINVMNTDGTLNDSVPEKYRGLKMHTTARAAVVADMEAAGLFNPETDREDREIELPHSDRSKTPIEPYLADQWFVKMDQLAQSAMDAVSDGRVKIVPDRYRKTYLDWLGEKRDWPVGRQLWWGHRVPVFMRAKWEGEDYSEAAVRGYFAKFVIGPTVGDDPERTRAAMEHFACAYANDNLMICFDDPSIVDAIRDTLVTKMGYHEDEEVLDTWFSSALWPHSTLGWPDKTPELAEFYPTSTLITSRDIITLWVARMVLAGLYNMGEVPFKEVYIHPKILDGYGETMSKSKGNGVDPLDVIEKFGADALRFGLAYLTTETQDVRMPVEFECPHCQHVMAQTKKNRTLTRIECEKCGKPFRTQWAESHGTDADKALPRGAVVSERFELGRRFCNKIWNASRFSLMNLDDSAATFASEPGRLGPGESQKNSGASQGAGGETPRLAQIADAELLLEDRWILARLATVTREVDEALAGYRFADASRALYEFAWNDFCDYYVEITKARFKEPKQLAVAQRMLAHVLDSLLRLLHPIVPFVTEEVWQLLNGVAPERGLGAKPQAAVESICVAEWPVVDVKRIDATIEAQFADFQAVLKGVREIRLAQNIPPRTRIEFRLTCSAATAKLLEPMRPYFAQIADATCTELGPNVTPPERVVSKSLGEIEIHVDVTAFFDPEAEKSRLSKEILNLRNHAESLEKKLSNEAFVSRAPADVVKQQRDLLAERRGQLTAAEAALAKLG
jgi:valyl-tRNA synthetase